MTIRSSSRNPKAQPTSSRSGNAPKPKRPVGRPRKPKTGMKSNTKQSLHQPSTTDCPLTPSASQQSIMSVTASYANRLLSGLLSTGKQILEPLFSSPKKSTIEGTFMESSPEILTHSKKPPSFSSTSIATQRSLRQKKQTVAAPVVEYPSPLKQLRSSSITEDEAQPLPTQVNLHCRVVLLDRSPQFGSSKVPLSANSSRKASVSSSAAAGSGTSEEIMTPGFRLISRAAPSNAKRRPPEEIEDVSDEAIAKRHRRHEVLERKITLRELELLRYQQEVEKQEKERQLYRKINGIQNTSVQRAYRPWKEVMKTAELPTQKNRL